MRAWIEHSTRFLESGVDIGPRALVLLAVLLLIPAYIFPLWNMTMFAPQYPEGLRLDIYSYKIGGGNNDLDVREVNVLNHYIGMHELTTESFAEFKWIPFVVGGMGLLFLRTAVLGKCKQRGTLLLHRQRTREIPLVRGGLRIIRHGVDRRLVGGWRRGLFRSMPTAERTRLQARRYEPRRRGAPCERILIRLRHADFCRWNGDRR